MNCLLLPTFTFVFILSFLYSQIFQISELIKSLTNTYVCSKAWFNEYLRTATQCEHENFVTNLHLSLFPFLPSSPPPDITTAECTAFQKHGHAINVCKLRNAVLALENFESYVGVVFWNWLLPFSIIFARLFHIISHTLLHCKLRLYLPIFLSMSILVLSFSFCYHEKGS